MLRTSSFISVVDSGLSGGALRPRESAQCAQTEEKPAQCAEVDLADGGRGLAGLLTISSI